MSSTKVTRVVSKFFEEVLGKTGRVIEMSATEEGWVALVETVEEGEYMRRFARDELLAIYEVRVGGDLEVIGYRRIGMRERTAVG